MKKICNLIDQNNVHIADISKCYSTTFNRILNARKLGSKYKISEFRLT